MTTNQPRNWGGSDPSKRPEPVKLCGNSTITPLTSTSPEPLTYRGIQHAGMIAHVCIKPADAEHGEWCQCECQEQWKRWLPR
jgi:hypothetical protein